MNLAVFRSVLVAVGLVVACSGPEPSHDTAEVAGVGSGGDPGASGTTLEGAGGSATVGATTAGTTPGSATLSSTGPLNGSSSTGVITNDQASAGGATGTSTETATAAGGEFMQGGAAGIASSASIGGATSSVSATSASTADSTSTADGTSTTGAEGSSCPVELVGFAALNVDGQNGTYGGGDEPPVEVNTLSDLKAAAAGDDPRVIVVAGTIRTTDDDGFALPVGSNKTIVGADRNATIYGGIAMHGVSNVIIRNLNIAGVWPNSGPDDTISSRESHHVWYDHLAVWDAGDGLLDITSESSYQTVSWSKFWYTNSSHDHRLASLVGSGAGDHPEDWGRLKVTYHHNWWAERVDQRMPRVVYGEGHVFNNFFNSTGNSYCIGVGSYGSVLVENNYFLNVNDPHVFMYDVFMFAEAHGNVYDNTTGARDTGPGGSRDACLEGDCSTQSGFDPGPVSPPYAYDLDAGESVPDLVTRCAGPQ